MPGWIKLPREIVLEPIYQTDKPFCDFAAYIDLLLLANHQSHALRWERRVLQVEDGDVITSLEKLAKRWNWGKPRVKRYLKVLESLQLAESKAYRKFTRIRLCKWRAYQRGQVTDVTANVTFDDTKSVPSAIQPRTDNVTTAYPINNEKNYKNEKNDKKDSGKNLNFLRAKKSYEELTEEEKLLAQEQARLYQQMLKSQIDFNKLCILVYGSQEDKEEYGFGDWQTLRKALGYCERDKLIYKVLHPLYYLWGLSRDKHFVEKMKSLNSA